MHLTYPVALKVKTTLDTRIYTYIMHTGGSFEEIQGKFEAPQKKKGRMRENEKVDLVFLFKYRNPQSAKAQEKRI